MMLETNLIIHGEFWERLNELSDGAAALCYQCGSCTAACPWGLVRQETFSVRAIMRQAQLGLLTGEDALWLCTTCGQCQVDCPRGVDIPAVMRALRFLIWEQNRPPAGLPTLLWSLHWNNNPWEQPPSRRSQWAQSLALPDFDPGEHEILYYVGCTFAYESRAQKVARALAQVLRAAAVSFGTLGEHEPCCGEEALSVGHPLYFAEIAQKAAATLKSRGVTRLVTSDPHSFDAFQNHYPAEFRLTVQSSHYPQYLAELVETGRLSFGAPLEAKITFHDPCYLARHNAETEAPRRVLAAIPGVELVEMENSGAATLCCGGGGGRMWIDTAAGERFSDLRVRQALATGAQILATACPYCIACLEDSLKGQRIQNLVVLDMAEIAALALAAGG